MHLAVGLLFCLGFTFINGYKDLGDGAVVSEVVNPATDDDKFKIPKSKLTDVKKKGANDRNAMGNEMRWPKGVVPYVIDRAANTKMVGAINAAIADFTKYTCVRFVKRTTQTDYINFFNGGDGQCYSYVGKIGGGQELSLGAGCEYKSVALHEMMHAIGFDHEQCRFDRDKYITVLSQNIDADQLHNYNKLDGTNGQVLGQTFNFAYDFGSIMHYSNDSFARPGKLAMVRKDGKPLLVQDQGFGDYDIKKINIYYQQCK